MPLGEGIVVRVGRYGPYLEVTGDDGEPKRASVPDDIAPDELTVAKARELLETQADGDRVLGTDPDSGTTIVARTGRYGPGPSWPLTCGDEAWSERKRHGRPTQARTSLLSPAVPTVTPEDARSAATPRRGDR